MIIDIIVWLIIGAVLGSLSGLVVKGYGFGAVENKSYGFGLVGNIAVGIIGAVTAGWLLPLVGSVIMGGIAAAIINAIIGAVILLVVVGLFKGD
jgi:uncharacterized membrane protein YeaQ/YmgE (transglycosylase-associated protein family)